LATTSFLYHCHGIRGYRHLRTEYSAANQPIVNGETGDPAAVAWGDGTLDEMCLAYVGVLEPFIAPDQRPARCASFADCRAECSDPDSLNCLWKCGGDEDACTQCVIAGSAQCLAAQCLTVLLAVEKCLKHCAILGGDVPACTAVFCPDEYAALDACATAPLAAGACDEPLAACGLTPTPGR
jgi:hypothetical protein